MFDATLETELSSGFFTLDEDLYDTAIMDEFSLRDLVTRLTGLNERVRSTQAFSRGLLKPRTVAFIRSVASRACILAKNMVNVHRTTDEIAVKRGNQIAEVLARMSLRNSDQSLPSSAYDPLAPGKEVSSTSEAKCDGVPAIHSASPSASLGVDRVQHSPLILKTLAWILENMHDPYPSISRKTIFAASTGSSLKSVNNSFDTARRRIGWTKFLKKHFNGKRALAVDCAHRVFIFPDPKYPVPKHICQDLLDMKMVAERIYAEMARNHDITEKAHQIINTTFAEVAIHPEANTSGGWLHDFGESRHSQIQSARQLVQSTESILRASKRMLNLNDVAAPNAVRKHPDPSILEPRQMRSSQKRRASSSLDNEEIEQDHKADPRPSKRKRLVCHASSDSLDSTVVPLSSLLTSCSSSLASPIAFIADADPNALHPFPELPNSDITSASLQYSTTTPQSSRKRVHSEMGHDYTPLPKRSRNASPASGSSAVVVTLPLKQVSHDLSGADSSLPEPCTRFDIIPNFSTAAKIQTWMSCLDYSMPGPVGIDDRYLGGALEARSFDRNGMVRERGTDDAPAINLPRSHIGETCTNLDSIFYIGASSGQELTAKSEEDLFAMFGPEDFGGDFADFPAIPEFNIDWTTISPPSFESFSPPSDLFSCVPIPISYPMTDEAGFYSSPGSASTLVNPSALSSSLLVKPSLQLDIVHSEFPTVLDLMHDAASTSDLIQDMSQEDRPT